MSPTFKLDEDSLFDFCQLNSHLRIERTATGELVIMSPTGSETGNRNAKLIQQLANWTDRDGTGVEFDSSAGFVLPNGATRSPDASWVSLNKWNSLCDQQKAKFAPICPDFVVEIASPSDDLVTLQNKVTSDPAPPEGARERARMQEYIDNGASLGWLIDRSSLRVYIYAPNQDIEILNNPAKVSGDPLLVGFTLDLTKIW
ncbi:MAG: Uma2 family endonuclease [Cyanobacteria bacterium J06642_3]